MDAPANPNDGSIEYFKTTAASPGNPLLIATDEEGGQVQRFQSLGALPAPEQVANSLSPAQAEAQIAQHGTKLKTIGIDMILGPLADVAPVQGSGPLGNRVFSNDPATVSAYAQAYVRGWQAAGLLPTLKHFPGLGSASGNTDYRPSTTPPLSSLEQRDFLPYKSLAGSGTAVMVGNQNVPGWFTGPASLSPVVDTYLRRQLGYTNSLIITDSLDAAAITATSSVADAVVNAISAGNDMVIIVPPNPADATGDVNSTLISQSEAALANAVTHSTLSKQQLATSVVRKLSLQHISACSLSSTSSHPTGS
jgi:beta-N-acetylhexosaminidase